MSSQTPKNIILYGPPGTGKTYATTKLAVQLCGEKVPSNEDDMKKIYKDLVKRGRIEFVTFHQSMSYEDFVEGRQPVTQRRRIGEVSSGGFRLEVVPGIFRRLARRAIEIPGESSNGNFQSIYDERIFKMSLGTTRNRDDDKFFEDAIENKHVLLDVIDVDLKDNKYSDYLQIRSAIESITGKPGREGTKAGLLDKFRNFARIGDIVVIPKGNTKFRAIGKFTEGYEYCPRSEGGYTHRRSVEWEWYDKDGDGLDVLELRGQKFISRPFYEIGYQTINTQFLESLINRCKIENYVLIIDEINRANISKVFGELITLVEPDKRLGQINETKVKLPYSHEEFGVPQNLHIIGTMNTADRSIAHMDTALRRRFDFRSMLPRPEVLKDKCEVDLPSFLEALNKRIEQYYDRDHQIGHGYFMECNSTASLDKVMRDKIIPLLAEYFFDDWNKLAAVLGDPKSAEGSANHGFLKKRILHVPKGLGGEYENSRNCWDILPAGNAFDYSGLTR